jgi:CHASE3 domain sensor protein
MHNKQGDKVMSKVKDKIETAEVEEIKTNGTVTSEDKAREAIETLKTQLQEHLRQAEHHRTMATKAQGALEVLLQLHPEEENSEG